MKKAYQALLIKWLCDDNEWIRKHMYALSKIIGREFTSLDLPYKNTRSHELLKKWLSKGLIRIIDYTKKARVYKFNSTLFAKAIEKQEISQEEKDKIMNMIDELI